MQSTRSNNASDKETMLELIDCVDQVSCLAHQADALALRLDRALEAAAARWQPDVLAKLDVEESTLMRCGAER